MHSLSFLLSAAVTIAAVMVYMASSLGVGRMRVKHSIKAPATSGHPEFDRAFRVQMNTLEQMAAFLPLLWLATLCFTPLPWAPGALGAVWIVGRILYWRGYMAAPEKRGLGFGIGALALVVLLVLAIVGIVVGFAG
jgi:glutathione S-transferase